MASIAVVRARARAIANEHRDEPRRLIDVALRAAKDGDEQFAFETFRAAPRVVPEMSAAQIDRLLPALHDWNSTDCFGSFVSGVAWREGVLTNAHIMGWTKSANLWIRRAALVSTVPLNLPARGATAPKGEAKMTLMVCSASVSDREDMVVKALSWALRSLASKDPAAVESFIGTHRSRLAARVLRETGNKLTTGLKNPRRA